VKRIRELYAQRRVFFIEQFQKWLGGLFRSGSNAGRFALRRLAATQGRFSVIHTCSRANRRLAPPLSFFCIKAQLDPAFVFGFAAWRKRKLNKVWQNLHRRFNN